MRCCRCWWGVFVRMPVGRAALVSGLWASPFGALLFFLRRVGLLLPLVRLLQLLLPPLLAGRAGVSAVASGGKPTQGRRP